MKNERNKRERERERALRDFEAFALSVCVRVCFYIFFYLINGGSLFSHKLSDYTPTNGAALDLLGLGDLFELIGMPFLAVSIIFPYFL